MFQQHKNVLWNSAAPGAALLCSWLKPASKWQEPARLAGGVNVPLKSGYGSQPSRWAAAICSCDHWLGLKGTDAVAASSLALHSSSVGRTWDQVCGELPAWSPEQSWSCHQLVPWARVTRDSVSAAPQLGLCLLKVWGCLLELVIHPTAGCKGEKSPTSAGWPQASSAPSPRPAVRHWDHMRPWSLLQWRISAVVDTAPALLQSNCVRVLLLMENWVDSFLK